MGDKGHGDSRNNLLGPSPTADLVTLFSNEKQVTKTTPPTFLTHAKTDAAVSVENSRMAELQPEWSSYDALLTSNEEATHVAIAFLYVGLGPRRIRGATDFR